MKMNSEKKPTRLIKTDLIHGEVTDQILAAFYHVYNSMGVGFLEKVYENAMLIELRQRGIRAVSQFPISVTYNNEVVGEYYADLLVEEKVIVEIKAVRAFLDQHEAQLLNYLKATQYEVGLLLNFGPKPTYKRRAYDNVRKKDRPRMHLDERG